jgi:hypothetical protein
MTIVIPLRSGAARRIGIFGVAAILAAFGLAGCGSLSDQIAATAFAAPSKFSLYSCKELEEQMKTTRARVLELEQLMARSAQGTGGQFVNAIAYHSDYVHARGQLKVLSAFGILILSLSRHFSVKFCSCTCSARNCCPVRLFVPRGDHKEQKQCG